MNRALGQVSHFNVKRIGGELFWIALGQAMATIGAFVGVRLMTGFLDPKIYGELALGMTLSNLSSQFLWGPLGSAFSRFFAPNQEAGKIDVYLRSTFILSKWVDFIHLGITGLAILSLWLLGYRHILWLVVGSMLFGLISGHNGNLSGIQNAARQRMVVAWHQGIEYWLRFLIAIAMISLIGAFSSVAMMGYCIASFIIFSSQIWFFKRKIVTLKNENNTTDDDEVHELTKKMLYYSLPFTFWGIFTWAQMVSDRWAIQFFAGPSDVGLYAVIYQIGYYPIAIMSSLITQLIIPILFSWAGDNSDAPRVQRTQRFTHLIMITILLLTAVASLLAFVLHKQIFLWLVAPAYRQVSVMLPWMILAGGLFTAAQMKAQILLVEMRTRALIAPKIITALCGIGFNFLGAYLMGLKGVVIACIGFSLIYFLWVLYLTRPKISVAETLT